MGQATRRRIWWLGLSVALGAAVFVVRFLSAEFENDHFVHLVRARQILLGEMPSRDFADPGLVLHYYASAAALRIFGYNLFGEALLTSLFMGLAAAITCWLSIALSGSALAGVAAAMLSVSLFPRLYNYPKIMLYVVALLAAWVYGAKPGRGRLGMLALCTAVAFLFRYDHGVYIGISLTAFLLLLHVPSGLRAAGKSIGTYGAAVGLLLLPYVLFLVFTGHLVEQLDFGMANAPGLGAGMTRSLPEFTLGDDRRLLAMEPIQLPVINIRWKPAVTQREREDAERAYGLVAGEDQGERTWQYGAANPDSANLAALVGDSRVEDTHRIDREGLRILESPAAARWRRWQTAFPPFRLRITPGYFQQANAEAWLTYTFLVLPYVAVGIVLLMTAAGRFGTERRVERALVLSTALMCFIIHRTLVRGSVDSRIADVAAPTAVLFAWTIGRIAPGWESLQRLAPARIALRASRGVLAAALAAMTLWSAVTVGNFSERLTQAGVFSGVDGMTAQWRDVSRRLRLAPLDSGFVHDVGVDALARYLSRCTHTDDRLLITGMAPDIFFYANRSFAGGQVFLRIGWHSSLRDQRQTLERLGRQHVPVAIVHLAEYEDLARRYPLINAHLTRRYTPVADSHFGGRAELRILVDRQREPSGTDQMTSLPCFA